MISFLLRIRNEILFSMLWRIKNEILFSHFTIMICINLRLTSQSYISGIGNWVADEVLYQVSSPQG